MLVQKQLGYCNKPIIILNTDGFYDNLLSFFDKIIEDKFASEETKNIYFCAKTPQEALNYIDNYDFREKDYLLSKLKLKN